MSRCELLTAGLWHDSIGDLLLMQTTHKLLARRGICVELVDGVSGARPAIIGPGAVLTGERKGVWWDTLAPFHAQGPHVLNAVGVASSGDFSYLGDYRYVSVRDHRSASLIADYCEPHVVPCPVTLTPIPPIAYYRGLLNCGFIKRAERFTVVDRELYDLEIGGNVIKVDTRPWQGGHAPSFKHRNPNVLAAVVHEADFVFASTLHLSILALAMGTPFIYWEPRCRNKGRDYWGRAGAPELIVHERDDLLTQVESAKELFADLRQREQIAAKQHIDKVAEAVK